MKVFRTALLACIPLAMGLSQVQAKEWRVGYGTGYSLVDLQFKLKDQINPGDVVLITSGTYGGEVSLGDNSLAINGFEGSPGHPITVRGEFDTDKPQLLEGVSVFKSKHVILQHLNIVRTSRETGAAAVVVSEGSSYVQLSHLSVHHSHVGVSFLDPGPGNSIRYSHILGNDHHGVSAGIAEDKSAGNKPANDSDASVIESNFVESNGGHGIDIGSPYWHVERNVVSGNGWAYGGTSGIHLFRAKDRPEDDPDCDRNEILYNFVSGQTDTTLADGNGIQIDHFCDGNLVAYNVAKNNSGAGISLYVGKGNTIASNTLFHNATDRNRIALGAYRAEMILGSEKSICPNDINGVCILPNVEIGAFRSSGNVIFDNIVVSGQADVPGIHVSEDFKDPARNINYLYVNWYSNFNNGAPLQWGYESTWDIDGKTSVGNILAPVSFVDSAANNAEGFELAAPPPNDNVGWKPTQRRSDMGGKFPLPDVQGQTSYWGAYYKCSTGPCPSN